MTIYKGLNTLLNNIDAVITIGSMDGVHLGHQKILSQVKELARLKNAIPFLITFNPHPRKVILGTEIELITTYKEKYDIIKKFFPEVNILELRFNKELANLSPENFIAFINEKIRIKGLVVGYDNHFGKDRKGNYTLLQEIGNKLGFELKKVDAVKIEGENISSSKIRTCIKSGDVECVNKMLGYDFIITGKVITGKGLGNKLGYPTANISTPTYKIKLAPGVYSAYTYIDSIKKKVALSVGKNPTVENNNNIHVEAHIINYIGNLYNKTLQINVLKKIREEKKFNSLQELALQIKKDIEKINI